MSDRVIDQLREKHPAMEWGYHHGDLYPWKGAVNGTVYLEVAACAAMAPKYDGDDDTFRTEYRYRDGNIAISVSSLSIGGRG